MMITTLGSQSSDTLALLPITVTVPTFPLKVIDGETMETVRDFIFLSSKITAGGDCSHEIKRHLLLERKAMTNLTAY